MHSRRILGSSYIIYTLVYISRNYQDKTKNDKFFEDVISNQMHKWHCNNVKKTLILWTQCFCDQRGLFVHCDIKVWLQVFKRFDDNTDLICLSVCPICITTPCSSTSSFKLNGYYWRLTRRTLYEWQFHVLCVIINCCKELYREYHARYHA